MKNFKLDAILAISILCFAFVSEAKDEGQIKDVLMTDSQRIEMRNGGVVKITESFVKEQGENPELIQLINEAYVTDNKIYQVEDIKVPLPTKKLVNTYQRYPKKDEGGDCVLTIKSDRIKKEDKPKVAAGTTWNIEKVTAKSNGRAADALSTVELQYTLTRGKTASGKAVEVAKATVVCEVETTNFLEFSLAKLDGDLAKIGVPPVKLKLGEEESGGKGTPSAVPAAPPRELQGGTI